VCVTCCYLRHPGVYSNYWVRRLLRSYEVSVAQLTSAEPVGTPGGTPSAICGLNLPLRGRTSFAALCGGHALA
jgi:hypothetical protein